MLKLYTYANCDTCRRAVKWLREQKIEVDERPIRETPPSRSELKAMLAAQNGDLRKLFNTSGRDYREHGMSDRLSGMSEADAFGLLNGNGNLVKRPFVVGEGVGLVGFDPKTWGEKLLPKRNAE